MPWERQAEKGRKGLRADEWKDVKPATEHCVPSEGSYSLPSEGLPEDQVGGTVNTCRCPINSNNY